MDSTDLTDAGSSRITAYWDTRDRVSSFQVANISGSPVDVLVQVFNVDGATECEECNFVDTLTPHDVHVYEIGDIVRNSDASSFCELIGSDTYGFAVVSVSSGPANSLVGVIRILNNESNNKYEYRANMAGEELSANLAGRNVISFDNVNGNSFSDLVGITYVEVSADTVYASPGVGTIFGTPGDDNLIFDDLENLISCAPTTFACGIGQMNRGIDNSLPNSKDVVANDICATSVLISSDSGFLKLPFESFECSDPAVGNQFDICQFTPHFVGFVGLNNGDGTGSFDSWRSREELIN